MAPLVKLAAVALLISSSAIAAPWNPVVRHTTHHSRSVGPNGVTASVYQPESTFETYGVNGIEHPLAKRATKASPEEAAKSFLESKLGVSADGLVRRTGHKDNRTKVSNEYFRQQLNGIQVANAVANVAVKDDKVLSFGASFIKPSQECGIGRSKIPKQNTTSGNNIISYKSSTTGVTSQSSATNNYDYEFNSNNAPTVNTNVDAARVNAFYVGNMIHDLTYRYGFTETSYNFQQDNNGLGGAQNDRVQISVQDSSGTNNAAFSTPPDGQSGRMRMYLWTKTSPQRDGALENDIVTHEYGHGISNRLTGGGTATCLQTTEARGLGEGWSDALADWTEQKSAEEQEFTLGSYVNTKNIRTFPYSTDKSINPRTYATLNGLTAVHSIGEVWALIWHEIYAALIEKHGFTIEKNNHESTAGNVVALHLYIDAMKLQPCNPTFIAARNAVIQADANRYNGANKCLLWTAYAKRGLGYGATTTKVDSMTLPSDC
ncbi:Fungalysin metallopeptidase-domain-containing protein [Rhizoctonia solani]|nr:Fungalysin metallopeptidase-domain-containing protein [Rhizoctonia solani]